VAATMFSGSAFAQRGGLPLVPKYSEGYNKRTGKLVEKTWNNEKHIRSELYDENNKTQIMILRSDSAKAYMVDPEKKTIMEFPTKQILSLAKTLGETDRNNKDEFIGKETIEGYECEHYITTITTISNGQTTITRRDSWWYQPYKMEIMSKQEALDAIVHRNIKLGAQPADLFELPKDYSMIDVNARMNNINNMFEQMKTLQNKQGTNNADKKAQDANKTQDQKMQDAMQMLKGLNKK
jgi:hypothetical protein